MKKGKKKLYIIIGILVVLGVLLVSLVNFITDLLWFKDLGYISVFLKQLITELEFGIPCFVVISAICFVYLLAIKKAYYKKIGGYEKTHSEKRVNLAALGLSLAFGLINAVRIAHELWFKILEFTNSTDFSILDPIFNQDVSFYIFKLGLLQDLNGMLLSIIIGFAIVNVLFYFCLLALRRPQFFERVSDEEYEEYRRREQEYQQQRQQQKRQVHGARGGLIAFALCGAALFLQRFLCVVFFTGQGASLLSFWKSVFQSHTA